jgi:hypothetical protein
MCYWALSITRYGLWRVIARSLPSGPLTARGESQAAFDGRSIPASSTPTRLPRWDPGAALLLAQILPVFSVVAPCWRGASPVSVRRPTFTTGCQGQVMPVVNEQSDRLLPGRGSSGHRLSRASAPRKRRSICSISLARRISLSAFSSRGTTPLCFDFLETAM